MTLWTLASNFNTLEKRGESKPTKRNIQERENFNTLEKRGESKLEIQTVPNPMNFNTLEKRGESKHVGMFLGRLFNFNTLEKRGESKLAEPRTMCPRHFNTLEKRGESKRRFGVDWYNIKRKPSRTRKRRSCSGARPCMEQDWNDVVLSTTHTNCLILSHRCLIGVS